MHGPSSVPYNLRADQKRPLRRSDLTGKPVLHIISQDRIDRQFRRLWPSGGPVSVPLCRGRSVFWSAVAGRRIALEFTRDRGWIPIELTSDGAYTVPLRAPDGDLLTFSERKVAL